MSIYTQNPPENKTYRFVLHAHARGRSLHLDFRYELEPGTVLLGWTIDALKSLSKRPENLSEAKRLAEEKMPVFIKKIYDPTKKWVVQTKKKEPYVWLNLDNRTFKPGTVGGTKNEFGYMWIIDKGTIEYGAQKASSNEFFIHGTKKWKGQSIWDGRLIIRALPNVWRKRSLDSDEISKTGKGYLVHMAFFADPEEPYVLNRGYTKKWYPPQNISALPKKIRSQIPKEYRYWEIKDSGKAHETRDNLVKAIRKKEVNLEYAEKFQEKPEPKKTPTIGRISTPSSSVLKKLKEILFYKPYPELRFKWVLTKNEKWACPDCVFLSKLTFTPHTLPTYPNEGKVQCRGYDKCELHVYFPDGKHYRILPVKDRALYGSEWVKKKLTDESVKIAPKELPPHIGEMVFGAIKDNWETIKALTVDLKNMSKVDKAFNAIEPGQTLLKDYVVAKRQAAKEVNAAMSKEDIEKLMLSGDYKSYEDKTHAVTLRLLREGQVLEVEKQLSIFEDVILEIVTSVTLQGISRKLYKALRWVVRKQGLKIHNKIVANKLIKGTVKQLADYKMIRSTNRVAEAIKRANTLSQKIKTLGIGATQFILDEIGYFVSFWKDAVLIGTTGVPIRNMMDNTLKTINEMLNSIFSKDRFWGFYIGKNKLVNIPKEVLGGFGQDAMGQKVMKEMEGFGVNWWNKWRERLYEGMFSVPENWARKGLYAGKLKTYEKQLFEAGITKSRRAYEEITEMAIKDVNRVFFDYSKKLAAEIPLQNLSPFLHYNALNFNYWLKDFMQNPWKLRVIKVVWDHWKDISGSFVPFKIIGKLFNYLIPGIKFNPLSWVSAYKFIQLFVMYKGDPEWLKASDRHAKKIVEISKATTPEQRVKIWGKTEAKSQEDFIERMKYKMVKIGVDTFDKWIGILPVWKKIIAELGFADKEKWRTVFPQSQLIKSAMDHVDVKMKKKLMNDIKRDRPPGRGQIETIIRLLKVQHKIAGKKPGKDSPFIGARINAKIKEMLSKMSADDLEIRKEKMKDESLKAKEIREMKEMDQAIFDGIKKEGEYIVEPLAVEIAIEIYYWWQFKKTLLGYFTGMWLSKRWNEIYKAHKAILEMLESKE